MSKLHDDELAGVRCLVASLDARVLGRIIRFRVERDRRDPVNGRIFVQCTYRAKCTVTGTLKEWRGRKWYLSEHMTDDEVVKTCFGAFKATVEHEVMEGFTFDGVRVFNPHTSFHALMTVSSEQVFRKPHNAS